MFFGGRWVGGVDAGEEERLKGRATDVNRSGLLEGGTWHRRRLACGMETTGNKANRFSMTSRRLPSNCCHMKCPRGSGRHRFPSQVGRGVVRRHVAGTRTASVLF